MSEKPYRIRCDMESFVRTYLEVYKEGGTIEDLFERIRSCDYLDLYTRQHLSIRMRFLREAGVELPCLIKVGSRRRPISDEDLTRLKEYLENE